MDCDVRDCFRWYPPGGVLLVSLLLSRKCWFEDWEYFPIGLFSLDLVVLSSKSLSSSSSSSDESLLEIGSTLIVPFIGTIVVDWLAGGGGVPSP
jgi:hypothetical protein